LFELRFEPELNTTFTYRAFLADPDNPRSLIVERTEGSLADRGQVDVTSSDCPAAAAQVARLASLGLPAAALEDPRPYDISRPYPATYHFAGFVHFPNGGEGEATFYAYDWPGLSTDPLLDWAKRLVGAVDSCRPRAR